MKKIFTIIFIILIIVLVFLKPKFRSGTCILNSSDGFIWQIDKAGFINYKLRGYFENNWGNQISMRKNVVERNNQENLNIYIKTSCPEINIFQK